MRTDRHDHDGVRARPVNPPHPPGRGGPILHVRLPDLLSSRPGDRVVFVGFRPGVRWAVVAEKAKCFDYLLVLEGIAWLGEIVQDFEGLVGVEKLKPWGGYVLRRSSPGEKRPAAVSARPRKRDSRNSASSQITRSRRGTDAIGVSRISPLPFRDNRNRSLRWTPMRPKEIRAGHLRSPQSPARTLLPSLCRSPLPSVTPGRFPRHLEGFDQHNTAPQ